MPILRPPGQAIEVHRAGRAGGLFLTSLATLLSAAVLPAGGIAAQRPAEEKKAESLERAVERLVQDLDADAFRVRRAAEVELRKLGPEILPLLPAPEEAGSLSIREAVRRIRVHLEYQQARESVQAARISLQGRLPLGELLTEFTRRTGNRFQMDELPTELLTQKFAVDYRNEEFWPALDGLLGLAGLRYEPDANAGALRLRTVQESEPKGQGTAYAGAFRITAESVELKPLGGDEEHQLLRMRLRLLCEPRLQALFVSFSGRDLTAATGETVWRPFSPQAMYELPLGEGGKNVRLQADFVVPAARVEELERVTLEGRLQVQTAAGAERFAFGDLLKDPRQIQRRGGVRVILRKSRFASIGEGQHKAEMQIAVSYDRGGPAFESHRTWLFHNRARLESDAGKPIEPAGPLSTELQADGGVVVGYTFNDLNEKPETYRFVYTAPTLIIDVPVEFTLELRP